MTTLDSTTTSNTATAQEKIRDAAEPVRRRPVASSAAALAVAAVAAAGVIGGRKYAQSRRSRSRWQQILDRLPLGRFR
ncbi:hypothetical protein [Actinoplanes sp. NPDC026670]|uniref:hypothetical protein n=1 Tax=Actinoplanes sp. NPDC026670 TaxID=3154700 RepID=UPI0033FA648E